ncbi:MAG: CPBP family glutamic-type intramembrane protease [Kiritimatiellaeota bacterium]|nr:CPBP family glutamic-type intramembrane protease [Kiritimatiellota bacterium]
MKRFEQQQRWVEFVLLYVIVPVVVTFGIPPGAAIPVLWVGSLVAWGLLKMTPSRRGEDAIDPSLLLIAEEHVPLRKALAGVFVRFAIGAALLTGLLLLIHPEWLFEFPKRDPKLWGIVVVAYPALSVFPQVVIYRCLFIQRYSSLFMSKKVAWFVGALVFGWAHLAFRNYAALLFPFVGGFLFIRTYQQTRSIALNVLEHSLYGCFLFTIGWGRYFFYGTQALLAA